MNRKLNLIYGLRAVMESVKAGGHFERVFIQKTLKGNLYKELMDALHRTKIPISKVPVERINKLTRKNHQGVVALISPIDYQSMENLIPTLYEQGRTPLLLILDEITDVRNFGALARTSECLGVDGIIIPVKGGAQVNEDAVKTSAGAFNYVPVCREENLQEAVSFLQRSGIKVIACSEKIKNPLHREDLTCPTAVIMGSEERGIAPALLEQADAICKIEMHGKIASLNVSVAAGMVFYEAQRQRTK